MTSMRWIVACGLLGGLAGGCKGSNKEGPKDKPAPAAAIDAAAAPPVVVDAAPVAQGPTLPPGARCSGHWTATALAYDDSKTCKDDQFAPYRELDLTVSAGPTGWVATVAKPAGLTASRVDLWWDGSDAGTCTAKVTLTGTGADLGLELSHGCLGSIRSRLDLASGDSACMGFGPVSPTYVPDTGPLPPVAAPLVALTGAYALQVALPAKYACATAPAAAQAFTIGVDRTQGDALTATGAAWPVAEVRWNGDPGALYLRMHAPDDEELELTIVGTIAAGAFTGTASLGVEDIDGDGADGCATVRGLKVTGTHTPAP